MKHVKNGIGDLERHQVSQIKLRKNSIGL